MLLWRLSKRTTLDGMGGLMASARWHTQGRRIVYCAETPAGALTEALVHLEVDPMDPPRGLKLLKIETGTAGIETLDEGRLGRQWKREKLDTREIGDEWLISRRTALLRVPSVIVPETFNFLLNPEHQDATGVRIVEAFDFEFDERLL